MDWNNDVSKKSQSSEVKNLRAQKIGDFFIRVIKSLLLAFSFFSFSTLGQYSNAAFQVNVGENVFVLVLCNGEYQANFDERRYEKGRMTTPYFDYHPQGVYRVISDTLILRDTVYGNEYAYLLRGEKLIAISPNYSFLLKKGLSLRMMKTGDLPQSPCSRSGISNQVKEGDRYKRRKSLTYYVDTVSEFVPASDYGMYSLRVKLSKETLKIFWDDILLFDGNYVIQNNRIIFYDNNLKRSFPIYNGIKSFKNIVLNFDRIIRNTSLEKSYSEREWRNVIDSAAEFKPHLGGKGAGPDTLIILD